MAKELVFLRYTFLFDAVDTWQHLSQFEASLADFFSAHNLEAEILKTVNGQMGERIMLLKNVDDLRPKNVPVKIQEPTEGNLQKMREQIKEAPRIKKGTESKLKIKDKPRVKLIFKRGRNYATRKIEAKLGGRR